MPELLEDPRFQTEEDRLKNASELEIIVANGLSKLNKREVFRTCGEWGALCGYVATVEDLLTDPQYEARKFWVDVEHPYTGKLPYPGVPAKMTETGWKLNRAPLLGEHNQEIYCDWLGYTREEMTKLREVGII
jgi:crotonobetainyl-CoA:carnitine CoA-transferase CaiB-like acyl-CoA transferase